MPFGAIKAKSLYHIRNRVAGGYTLYDVPGYLLRPRWISVHKDHPKDSFYISEMCPTHLTQIQGEVFYYNGELNLYYSTIKEPMRSSLAKGGRQVKGLAARMALRTYMNPASYSWTKWLLSQYPNHVIEFTTLSRCWGTNPGYNTLFWEVRRY